MRLKNKTGLKVIQIKKEKVKLSLSADGIILFAVIIFDCTESLLLRGVSPVAAHGHLIAEASHSTGLSLRGLLIAGASHCGGFSLRGLLLLPSAGTQCMGFRSRSV